jgi:outer membrane lipoprotein SlyB
MNSMILRGLLLASCIAVPGAHAADADITAPLEVHGIKLGSLCAGCGVVEARHVETHDGSTNGAGAVTGALVGGVLGNQIGRGSGRGAATVLGAIGGGFAGNAIQRKANRVETWQTTVAFRDGSTRTFEDSSDPGLYEGQVVRIVDGRPARIE